MSSSLILAVAVPTLVVEEDWHGRPMIDQPTHLWVIAAALVVIAFLFGGVMTGYRRRTSPALYALISGCLSVTILLGSAIFRRLFLIHDGAPKAVLLLWCVGGIAAILTTVLGSLIGRGLGMRSP